MSITRTDGSIVAWPFASSSVRRAHITPNCSCTPASACSRKKQRRRRKSAREYPSFSVDQTALVANASGQLIARLAPTYVVYYTVEVAVSNTMYTHLQQLSLQGSALWHEAYTGMRALQNDCFILYACAYFCRMPTSYST